MLQLALRHPRRAAQLAGMLGPQPDALLEYARGLAFLRWERIEEAQAALTHAHAGFCMRGETRARLRCELLLLMLRQLAGAGPALEAEWRMLAGAAEAAGAPRIALRARNELCALLNLYGRQPQALQLAEANADLVERSGRSADRARHAWVYGVAAAACADVETASRLLGQARTIYLRLRRPVDLARVRFEQGWLLTDRGWLEQGWFEYQRALACFQRFELPLRVALCEKDLSIVAVKLGRYAQALAYAVHARERFAALGRRDYVARCDTVLGNVSYHCGMPDLALAAYRQAEQEYRDFGDPRLVLMCQRNQALALVELQHYDAALELLAAIEPALLERGSQLEYAEALRIRARALHQTGEPDAARTALHMAHRSFLEHGNQEAAARCLVDAAWFAIDQQQWLLAEQSLLQVGGEFVAQPAQAWRVYYGLGRVAAQRGEWQLALQHYATAGKYIAVLRSQLAGEHASSGLYARARQLVEDVLELAARLGDLPQLLAFVEQQRALSTQYQLRTTQTAPTTETSEHLQQMRRNLLELLQQRNTSALDQGLREYARQLLLFRHQTLPASLAPELPDFDLQQTRQALTQAYGRDWSVLTPVLLADQLLLLLLTPETLSLQQTSLTTHLREFLKQACNQRYQTYLSGYRLGASTRWEVLEYLSRCLLPAELSERLHPDHRLLIVPSGLLHGLPWAALRINDRWLCEQAVIEYLPALALAPSRPPECDRSGAALLIGCAEFGERAPALKNTLESLELASKYWNGPCLFLSGSQATRSELLRLARRGELQSYSLIHIASHAALHESHGLLGHIKLADADLFVDEVLQLKLGGALVVLAACKGAAGEVLPGDEVLGLSRALLAAGARAVLASLWQVHDGVILQLLDRFYCALAAGHDAAKALALAQRELIAGARSGNPASDLPGLPYSWANFAVTSIGLRYGISASGTPRQKSRNR